MPHDDRVTLPSFPSLTSLPATEHPDLVAYPVAAALAGWEGATEVAVVAIDPDLADTAAMGEAYDIPMTASGNCVVVAGARAGDERVAACVVRADTRADVNTLVRKMLDVRKARIHTLKSPNPRINLLLRGEAASFSTIYAGL